MPGCAKGRLRAFPVCDVSKEDRDVMKLRLVDAERVHVEPSVERRSLLLESLWCTCAGNGTVNPEPMLFMRRRELPHPSPRGVPQSRLLFERVVHLQEPIVFRYTTGVEQHLDRAEALIKGVEDLIAVRIKARRLRSPFRRVRVHAPPVSFDRTAVACRYSVELLRSVVHRRAIRFSRYATNR